MELGRLVDEVHGSEKMASGRSAGIPCPYFTSFFFFSLCQTCNWPATEMTNNIIVVKIQCYIDSWPAQANKVYTMTLHHITCIVSQTLGKTFSFAYWGFGNHVVMCTYTALLALGKLMQSFYKLIGKLVVTLLLVSDRHDLIRSSLLP